MHVKDWVVLRRRHFREKVFVSIEIDLILKDFSNRDT